MPTQNNLGLLWYDPTTKTTATTTTATITTTTATTAITATTTTTTAAAARTSCEEDTALILSLMIMPSCHSTITAIDVTSPVNEK